MVLQKKFRSRFWTPHFLNYIYNSIKIHYETGYKLKMIYLNKINFYTTIENAQYLMSLSKHYTHTFISVAYFLYDKIKVKDTIDDPSEIKQANANKSGHLQSQNFFPLFLHAKPIWSGTPAHFLKDIAFSCIVIQTQRGWGLSTLFSLR